MSETPAGEHSADYDALVIAIRALLDKHWEHGTAGSDWTCDCGYPLGDGMGDLEGRHRAHVAEQIAARIFPSVAPCVGNDPTCPCQDGDLCHYVADETTSAMRVIPSAACCGSATCSKVALCIADRRFPSAETAEVIAAKFDDGCHQVFSDDGCTPEHSPSINPECNYARGGEDHV